MGNVSNQAKAVVDAFGAAGTFRRVQYRTTVRSGIAAANKGRTVVKVSEFTARAGVDYANLKATEGRETGGLPYGEWAEGYEGLVILADSGEQVRVTWAPNAAPRSSWTIDGQPATRQEVAALMQPAAAKRLLEPKEGGVDVVVMNLRVEGILRVGDVTLTA